MLKFSICMIATLKHSVDEDIIKIEYYKSLETMSLDSKTQNARRNNRSEAPVRPKTTQSSYL
jgi:hypothetical protein